MAWTKEQFKEYNKIYYANNKEKYIEKAKKYVKDNKEKVKETKRKYLKTEAGIKSSSECAKRNYLKNKKKIALQVKLYNKKNKERVAKTKKTYRESNLEANKVYMLEYYENNKEKIKKERINISDKYVIMILRRNHTGLSSHKIPQEIIELKRILIKTERLCQHQSKTLS